MRARIQETLGTAINVYLTLVFLILPLYMQDGYVMIGNVKYLFFRNVTLFFVLVTTAMQLFFLVIRRRQDKRTGMCSCTDAAVLLYGGCAVLSWCFSDDRYRAWWGAPGWYMGLLSQLLFVWIYFAASRWCCEYKGILWAFFAGAAAVTALGLLNRYVFDPLSMFVGLEPWDREHLLSTIGNQNWYCGYVSVASAVCICFACAGGRIRRAAGMAGSLLFFWTILTQGSEGGYLILFAETAVLFFWGLDERRKLLNFFCVLICCPVAALLGKYCIRFRGLILVEDGTLTGFLFWKGWLPMLLILAAVTALLYVREKRGCMDRLKSGRVKKTLLWTAGVCAVFGAGVFLVCQIWEGVWIFLGENTLLRITDSWGNSRGALWRMSLGSFVQAGFWDKWIGAGPDCFGNVIYALYPVNDIIHATGQWEDALFVNAHNEWLNMLINQGILGLIFYMGIFATIFARLRKAVHENPYALLGLLAISGYCAYGFVSFQQVTSTPLMFAVLGISESMLRRKKESEAILY